MFRPNHYVENQKGTVDDQSGDLETPILYEGDREFETVCEAFNEMQSHILKEQEKNQKYEKARIDMVAGISHALRTPLTAIRGTIKGLMDGIVSSPEQQKKFLTVAYTRTEDMERLHRILDNLFENSRKYSQTEPLLMKLEVSRENGEVILIFRDNGAGYGLNR